MRLEHELSSIKGIIIGNKESIWTAGNNGILNKIDPDTKKTEKIKVIKDESIVFPIGEDNIGNIFFGTAEGVGKFNLNSQKSSFTKMNDRPSEEGFIDAENNFACGVRDASNSIYLCLSVSDNFFAKVKLPPSGDKDTYKEMGSTEYSISSNSGINLTEFTKNIPTPCFSFIKILDKNVPVSDPNLTDSLVLKHYENSLSFGFRISWFGIDYKVTYKCMLEGVDTKWIDLQDTSTYNYSNLEPGNYIFKVKAVNPYGAPGEERRLYISIIPAFWQTTWFKIFAWIISIAIITSLIYLFYKNKIRQIKLKSELEKEKILKQQTIVEFEKELATINLTALRSQVKPHFIYNCLNSIKLYIKDNQSEIAEEYLTMFATLLRKVLEYSEREKINLNEEMEVLKLYLELEKMRFKDKLEFNIALDPDVDRYTIEIPPLLLQPMVENAVIHGILAKKDGGKIKLKAKILNDELLEITIKDNGIGRKRSAEINKSRISSHTSFGTRLTQERIELLNQGRADFISYAITDLLNEDGSAAGTLVIVRIKV